MTAREAFLPGSVRIGPTSHVRGLWHGDGGHAQTKSTQGRSRSTYDAPSALVVSAAIWMMQPVESAQAMEHVDAPSRVGSVQREQIQQWMTSLTRGDRAAFNPLFEALWPIVSRVASRMLPNRADADDAAQDALIKLASRVGEFDPARDAVSWAIGITIFECRTWRKRLVRRREETLDGAVHGASTNTDPEEEAIARDLTASLTELLEQLSPMDAETIREALRESDGAHGATFRKRMQRAVDRLRAAWRSTHGDE